MRSWAARTSARVTERGETSMRQRLYSIRQGRAPGSLPLDEDTVVLLVEAGEADRDQDVASAGAEMMLLRELIFRFGKGASHQGFDHHRAKAAGRRGGRGAVRLVRRFDSAVQVRVQIDLQ